MKYTKLFNNHNEYVAYIASESFIRPNVSYCIQEDESHCTPISDLCIEQHIYEIMGDPSYPSSVPASATSFELSFTYTDTYTAETCEQGSFMDGDTVTIPIEENPSTSARTITGTYVFHDISIPYSFTQEGKEELPYDQQYLTFNILNGGKILWKSIGSNMAKTISYSKDNGSTWTEITATSQGAEIDTVAGDKVLFKGTNSVYAKDKSNYSGFDISGYTGTAATYNIEGNIMSLIYGDNFIGNTAMTGTYNFCSIFKASKAISAENLVLPSTSLTQYCYRAMFSWCETLSKAPQLPATTLAQGCYWYMFEKCALTTAPDLLAETLVAECYGHMFEGCSSLNYIKALAVNGFNASNCKARWTTNVSSKGEFVKSKNVTETQWSKGADGIPTNWTVHDETSVEAPVISFNGFETITLSCETEGADILYKLNNTGEYNTYTTPITIDEDTFIETYSEYEGETSRTISQTCQYVSTVPIEYSNRDLKKWQYGGQEITTPYSINAIDGHSSSYAKGTFTFETSFALKEAEPTYLWFQHADQSASIYVDDILVEKHWGGYAAFTTNISEYVHGGINNIKVAINNNEGNNVAPASGDFNFNATLGNVRLLTSPYVPAMEYGYDGFHITSTVSDAEATVNINTSVPTGATLVCKIDDGNTNIYSATSASTGDEMTFTKVIANPHLWNGKSDPYLYTVTLEIYKDNEIYHRFVRPYGLRYYEYVINDTEKVGTVSEPYTGFLLNGSPYLLRGCCMHDDIDGKANALDETDYDNTFATIQELGLNFLRLAHYPHPKEVYDRCDALGIVVQTEGPCVNKLQSTMPTDYYTHLTSQYTDMVNQHYNHPCIFFWGLSNETQTDDKNFGKQKVEEYTALIKNLDSERMVGYVLAQGPGSSPSAYYNDPSNVDWFGCNIYVGWYDSPNSNNPSGQITTRLNNTIGRVSKPMAYSEYGCGGTPTCHSDDFMTTTTRGNNPRHDIEYMMWLHEGHIAAIKNFPQLMYTSQWQLFDIAVASRNEGYTVCLDGENTSIDNNLRRLNNKGLVERDHVTKKDTFYLYKAWWNTTEKFVHICGKNYTNRINRVIKCYSNDGDTFKLYVNGTLVETVTAENNIVNFTQRVFNANDVVKVSGETSDDTFTFDDSPQICSTIITKYNITDTSNPTIIGGRDYSASIIEIEIDGDTLPNVVSAYTFSTTGEHTVKYTIAKTKVKSYAFNNCDMVSIEMSNDVTELNAYCFNLCTSLTSVTIPDSVVSIDSHAFEGCNLLTNVTIGNGVKTIGESAFKQCASIESILIPSGVTSIEKLSFAACENLTSITVDNNNATYDSRNGCNAIIRKSDNALVIGCKATTIPDGILRVSDYAFYQCFGLTSIDIPDSVTSIGQSAFYDCIDLGNCDIGSGVTSISHNAFEYCFSLESIDIPDSVTSVGDAVFKDCKNLSTCTIGNGLKSITSSSFKYCSGLTSCTIGNGVTSIGTDAFNGCKSLTSIDIPNSVKSIGGNAFQNCTGLTSCTIGSGVTSISNYAFQNCSSLTSINMPNSVTSIGNGVFSGCKSLTSIDIPNSVTSISQSAFSNCSGLTSCTIGSGVTSISSYAFSGCKSLASIDIPNSVTSIGTECFKNCTSLTSCTIGSGVTSIGYGAFTSCNSLTSIGIPDSVTSIGESAFNSCSGLTSCTIGDSVTNIGHKAFQYCRSLTSVTVRATTPPTLGIYAFDNNASGRKIYVPSENVETYKSASGWSTYVSDIEPIQY